MDDSYPHDLMGPAARPPSNPRASVVAMAKDARRRELSAVDELEEPGAWGAFMAALPPWRVAGSVLQLIAEANETNPGRDKSSDGTIVGPGHTTDSDHYPRVKDNTGKGVVLAGDIDSDGLNMAAAVERARQLAHAGQLPQLAYAIYSGRITAPDFSEWRQYRGSNPHVTHAHFSARTAPQAVYDDRRRWGIFAAAPAPAPTPPPPPASTGQDLRGRGRTLRGFQGDEGPRVGQLQAFLRDVYPAYRHELGGQLITVDRVWGRETSAWLRTFAHRSEIPEADGLNIGPKIAAALYASGFDRAAVSRPLSHARAMAARHLARSLR